MRVVFCFCLLSTARMDRPFLRKAGKLMANALAQEFRDLAERFHEIEAAIQPGNPVPLVAVHRQEVAGAAGGKLLKRSADAGLLPIGDYPWPNTPAHLFDDPAHDAREWGKAWWDLTRQLVPVTPDQSDAAKAEALADVIDGKSRVPFSENGQGEAHALKGFFAPPNADSSPYLLTRTPGDRTQLEGEIRTLFEACRAAVSLAICNAPDTTTYSQDDYGYLFDFEQPETWADQWEHYREIRDRDHRGAEAYLSEQIQTMEFHAKRTAAIYWRAKPELPQVVYHGRPGDIVEQVVRLTRECIAWHADDGGYWRHFYLPQNLADVTEIERHLIMTDAKYPITIMEGQSFLCHLNKARGVFLKCLDSSVPPRGTAQDTAQGSNQTPPNPATPTAQTESGSVKLFGPAERPIVNGREQDMLTPPQYDTVLAAIEAGTRGLTKDELDTNSGRGDARKILDRMRKLPDWDSVIKMAGKTGGRYRIL